MGRGAVQAASGAATAEGERERILLSLQGRVDELAARGVDAICAEIPGYRERGPAFLDDVRDQVHKHYLTKLGALLEQREVTLDDIAFVRGAATRRARAGFALSDYMNAYRVGAQVIWGEIVGCAAETVAGHEAALSIVTPMMRYTDFVSRHAGEAYVEFQQYAIADADRERRDLLERLLAGDMPSGGPLLAAAESYGIGATTPMLVVAAIARGAADGGLTPHAVSAALSCAGIREGRTLVVVRHAEIVAVPTLGPGLDAGAACERLADVQRRLRREGASLAMGVSTPAAGVAELPRAYAEARAALECVGEAGGVAALPRLSAFEYLTRRADETASRVVDPRVREFLAEDRRRGGMLTATVRAFADCDLNLRLTAERLQVHPNTAQYRLSRIEERTGRNPRRVADLLELLVAISLDGA